MPAPSPSTSPRLLAIAVRRAPRAPMELVEEVRVTPEEGIPGDPRSRPGPRQVTVLARESWEAACAELGETLPWTERRANLLLEGVALEGTAGHRLRLGEVVLEITGETRPCQRMERHPGLRSALAPRWRGGVTCRVLAGGLLRVGAEVRLEAAPAPGENLRPEPSGR